MQNSPLNFPFNRSAQLESFKCSESLLAWQGHVKWNRAMNISYFKDIFHYPGNANSAWAVTISHFAQKSINSTGRYQLMQVSEEKSREHVTCNFYWRAALLSNQTCTEVLLVTCETLTTASCCTGHSLPKQLTRNRYYQTELVWRHQYYQGKSKKKIHLEIGPVLTNRYQNTSTILYHTSGWEVWGWPSGNLLVSGWNRPTLDTIEKLYRVHSPFLFLLHRTNCQKTKTQCREKKT